MRDLLHTQQPKQLRPHQARAIDLLRSSLAQGNRKVVIQGPTGFGKTLTAAKIIEGALAKNNKVIFTAPAVSLIDQTVAAFANEGIHDVGVMQANHPRTNSLARVQVASVDTLARRDIPEAALVIVDECHIRRKVIDDLMQQRQDVFFVGLSATPWRKGMGLVWDDLVIPVTIGDLIAQGYLSQFAAFAPDVPDMTGVGVGASGDYLEGEAQEVMEGKALMASVVQTWLERGQNRPTLLFGVNRAHAKALQEQFERNGIAAGYCDAFTDTVERALLAERFKAGEIKVACSVRTLTTGVDWPVSCIIDAAPTRSEMLHVQKIGRGLRVNPGTEDLLILDHAGNSLRLGLVTDIQHQHLDKTEPGEKQERKKGEKLPKECGNCGAVVSTLVCPFCGHERKPVAGVETVDGELVEITSKAKAPTKAEKQVFYSQLLGMAFERRYKPGWAANKYREKFGVWPKGLDKCSEEPGPEVRNWVKSRQIAWAKKQEASRVS